MKKFLLLIVCLMMIGMQSVQAQVAIAALHHEGNVSIYQASALQEAINVAVKGDTIYLSEGVFGGFKVSEPIAIIGSGQTTVISGNVSVGKQTGSVDSLGVGFLLSGLSFVQNVNFYNTIVGARVMQCKITGNCTFSNQYSSGSFDEIEIIMSQIGELELTTYVKGLTVVASKLSSVSGTSANEGSATFLNCNIGQGKDSHGNYVACILETAYYGVYSNCLYYNYGSPVFYNCYYTENNLLDEDQNCTLTDDQLKAAGYVGSDNTWVGINGGEVKFSLVMPIVQVTEHSLEVDQAERKLKVSLKLGNK